MTNRSVYFLVTLASLSIGCASVPPQVAQLHQKEYEILASLQKSHMAMVDAYVNQEIVNFESFFFKEYGPSYLNHWRDSFKTVYGRDYDEGRDFNLLYTDLVAEYQSEVAPIEEVRQDLKKAISREYRHAMASHDAVGAWLNSMEKLNGAQRQSLDGLLGSIKPGFSLNSVDEAIQKSVRQLQDKISSLTVEN